VAAKDTIYNVFPNASADAWLVTQDAGEVRGDFPTKEEAIHFARGQARDREPSTVKVYAKDGSIEHQSTYGERSNGASR
jgi:hypothetical protein